LAKKLVPAIVAAFTYSSIINELADRFGVTSDEINRLKKHYAAFWYESWKKGRLKESRWAEMEITEKG